ncbi:hypothetical protein [Herbaspirillum rubrisubalbicans]|uniref:hypothetical protein n=1 Tax=Herbaspirillum rubrisubalbicans TaxID=80842 RepID=UPI0012E36317|nr:hypothetical protein [Herbaspirillum rubrisubalbicans]
MKLILTICAKLLNDQFSISMLGLFWLISRKRLSDKALTVICRDGATMGGDRPNEMCRLKKISHPVLSELAAPAAAIVHIAAAAVTRFFASP